MPFKVVAISIECDVAPGVGKSWTVGLRVGGVDYNAVISDNNLSARVPINASIAALDDFFIICTPSNTPAAAAVWGHLEVEAASFPVGSNVTNSIAASGYLGFFGWSQAIRTVESDVLQTVPIACTVRNLRLNLASGALVSGGYTATLMKNGVPTALSVSSGFAALDWSDTTHSVSFAPGDTISWQITYNTPSSNRSIKIGCEVVPDVPGEAMIAFGTNGSTNNATPRYNTLFGGGQAWTTTEALCKLRMPRSVVKALYVGTDVAPGAAKSYAIDINKNGAQALTATVSGAAATTASQTGQQIAVADGDYLTVKTTPSGAPAAAKARAAIAYTMPQNQFLEVFAT